jgi:YVTN family beta-propeller protein
MYHPLGRFYITLATLALALFCFGRQIQAQTQLAALSFEREGYYVAVDPSRDLIYVPTGYFFGAGVEVVDGDRNSPTFNNVLAHIPLPTDSVPLEIAMNPNSNRVYIGDDNSSRVLVIDGSTNTLMAAIPVGPHPRGLAVNSATNRIYVDVPDTNSVVVINGDTNTVAATIHKPVENGFSSALAINPLTNRLYVANFLENSVWVIDGTSNSVVATIGVGSLPRSVAVNPATDRIYVSNLADSTVSVINGSTNTVEVNIPVGFLCELAVNSVTGRIYVTNSDTDIAVLDGRVTSPTYNTVLSRLSFPARMYDVAVNPTTNLFYVTTGMLMVFDDPPPPPAEGIAALVSWVRYLNLSQGTANSLESKLRNALAALDSPNGRDTAAACNKLDAFIGEVQSHEGKQITPIQARELIAEATRIKSGLGCD